MVKMGGDSIAVIAPDRHLSTCSMANRSRPCIIIDNGTEYLKAGLSTNNKPTTTVKREAVDDTLQEFLSDEQRRVRWMQGKESVVNFESLKRVR